MPKKLILRIGFIVLICFLILFFLSCQRLVGNDNELLQKLYKAMESGGIQYEPIRQFLPTVNDDKVVEFKIDLTDNLLEFDYTYYLKCKLSEKELEDELLRLKKLGGLWPTIDEEKGLIYWDTVNIINGKNSGRTNFMYAIWSEDGTIVYVESRSYSPATAREIIPEEYWIPVLDEPENTSFLEQGA